MKPIKKLTLSAMFVALGLVLPIFTGQIKQIGNMLLPMHIPVFLCGLICGWQYGAAVGFILPLLRWAIFGMPVFYPSGIAMAVELMTYGLVAGFLYNRSKRKGIGALYGSIISAMIIGRGVWGVTSAIIYRLGSKAFTLKAFLAGAFINAVPGIAVQLILIPAIILVIKRNSQMR